MATAPDPAQRNRRCRFTPRCKRTSAVYVTMVNTPGFAPGTLWVCYEHAAALRLSNFSSPTVFLDPENGEREYEIALARMALKCASEML